VVQKIPRLNGTPPHDKCGGWCPFYLIKKEVKDAKNNYIIGRSHIAGGYYAGRVRLHKNAFRV
jgi:hypothetical protein